MTVHTTIETAIIERESFAKALARTIRAAESKSSIAALGMVLIRANTGGSITMECTDHDIAIRATVTAVVEAPFEIAVDAQKLDKLCKKAKACELVTITVTDAPKAAEPIDNGLRGEKPGEKGKAAIAFGKLRLTAECLHGDDFPRLKGPESDSAAAFALPTADLGRALGKVKHAISTEETRYYLNGVFLTLDNNALRFVTCDGHRLAAYDYPAPNGASGLPNNAGHTHGVIIPLRAVLELHRIASAKDTPATVTDWQVSQNKVTIHFGEDLTVTSKLIDGTFPDYHRVIPQSWNWNVETSRKELIEAIEQVGIISPERGRACKFAPAFGQLGMEARNQDEGTATDTTITANVSKTPDAHNDIETASEWGANMRYMLDALATIGSDNVQIGLTDNTSPLRIIDPDDDALTYTLMPMRV